MDSSSQTSTSTSSEKPKKSFKQSCDTCRRRKIKCSRELPCDKCNRLLLSCSYSDVLRRKGPKFRTLYPLAPIHPLVSRPQDALHYDPRQYPTEKELLPETGGYPLEVPAVSPPFAFADMQYPPPRDTSESSSIPLPPPELVSSPDSTNSWSDSLAGQVLSYTPRLSSPVLLAHVNVYLKYLFPIMPVIRKEQLQLDCHQPERLTTQRYALVVSLCAATHVQLKLDGARPVSGQSTFGSDGHSVMSGDELLAEAVRARKECDPVDEIGMESLLTSFFLFISYSNLNRPDRAWFYLCQAISMVFTLGLHRESTYSELSVEDAEEKRRVFWLLFVTERGWALQQAKPVMLRNSIHKPQVLCSEDPILAYGFINLINVFEKVPVNLYDWLSAGCGEGFLEMPPTSSILSSLAKSMALDGVLEIQKVDILITQQWLQTMMWKLSLSHASQPGPGDGAVLPFHLPILVGKAVMNVISTASQPAVDAHGIGMEQKLFDIGSSVADVTRSLGSKAVHHLSESIIDPRELLWGVLGTLSRIRGSQSDLFPTLLDRCKSVLDMGCSMPMFSPWRRDLVPVHDDFQGKVEHPERPPSQMAPPPHISSDMAFHGSNLLSLD